MTYYMWTWQCGKCSTVGSAPVDIGTPVFGAAKKCVDHHRLVSANCATFGSDSLEVIEITKYAERKGKRACFNSEKRNVRPCRC